jgi:hypothetical protein
MVRRHITLAVGLLDQQPYISVDEEPQQETRGERIPIFPSPLGGD